MQAFLVLLFSTLWILTINHPFSSSLHTFIQFFMYNNNLASQLSFWIETVFAPYEFLLFMIA